MNHQDIANLLFGKTQEGSCVICKEEVIGFRDDLSRKEFKISGMCQSCQDETFTTESQVVRKEVK